MVLSIAIRAHPAISHCSHLLLKCRVATIISHWLKVHSRWFKNYTFVKKCTLISFWIFQYCFYFSFTLYYCAIMQPYLTLWMLPSGCQQFGSRSGPTLCRAWFGSNLFAKVINRWQKLLLGGNELNTEQLVDTTFWLKSISFGSNFFHLAKVLATTNSEPG